MPARNEGRPVALFDPPPPEDGARKKEGMGGHGRVEPAVGGGCGASGEEGEDGASVGWRGVVGAGLLRRRA